MDKWTEVDLPVLVATANILNESRVLWVTSDAIAATTGLAKGEVVKSFARLGTKYVELKDDSSLGGRDYSVQTLTADGLVAAEVWPSETALQERFVSVLERMIEETPEGSPKARRLAGLLGAVRELGTGTAGSVLGQIISGAIGS